MWSSVKLRPARRSVGAASLLTRRMPIEAKRAHADVIIDNAGSLEATRRQALTLYHRLLADPPPPRTDPER